PHLLLHATTLALETATAARPTAVAIGERGVVQIPCSAQAGRLLRENRAMARSALVTGGSSGIGLAIARMLREECFELTLASLTAEKVKAAAAELGAHAVVADIALEEDCEGLAAAHAERFGGLEVLVNSAGVGMSGRVEELSTKHWDVQLDVNLRGVFLVTRAAVPLLRSSHGLVVNIASLAGTIPAPGLAAYGAAK